MKIIAGILAIVLLLVLHLKYISRKLDKKNREFLLEETENEKEGEG